MAVKAQMIFASPEDEGWLGPAPVSFNPETLSIQIGSEAKTGGGAVTECQGVNPKKDQEPVIQVGGISYKTVSMELKFDMVDLYRRTVNARKRQDSMDKISAVVSSFDSANLMQSAMNGVGVLMTPTDYSQVSLMNPDYSCYSLLEQAAACNLPVGFLWGSMQFVGVLVGFSSQFVYFSDQGAPLRADVSISIRCGISDPQGEAAMKQAQAQQEQETARAQPGAV